MAKQLSDATSAMRSRWPNRCHKEVPGQRLALFWQSNPLSEGWVPYRNTRLAVGGPWVGGLESFLRNLYEPLCPHLPVPSSASQSLSCRHRAAPTLLRPQEDTDWGTPTLQDDRVTVDAPGGHQKENKVRWVEFLPNGFLEDTVFVRRWIHSV